jgi:phospholipase/carboxylesterase
MNRMAEYLATKPRVARNLEISPLKWESLQKSAAMQYASLGPMHYEPKYAYPLFIWLHGSGGDERQLHSIMPHISLRNYVAIAPRGTTPESNQRSFTWTQSSNAIDSATQYVHDCIAIATEKYHINSQKIFIGGLESGGTMALKIATSQPERFAGVISLNGPFPLNSGALCRYKTLRQLPLLMQRCIESTRYTEAQFQEELNLFFTAGMKVHYRKYLCGDEIFEPMLRDIDRWMMERVTGQPAFAEEDSGLPQSS